VQELAQLTGLSKAGRQPRPAGRLEHAGYVEEGPGKSDGAAQAAQLTAPAAFEARVTERLRAHLALAYRPAVWTRWPGPDAS